MLPDSHNGMSQTAPLPTITVVLHPKSAGPNGEYYFEPAITSTHMPGGWRTVHHGLLLALAKVLPELEKQVKNEGVIKVATQIPGRFTG